MSKRSGGINDETMETRAELYRREKGVSESEVNEMKIPNDSLYTVTPKLMSFQ